MRTIKHILDRKSRNLATIDANETVFEALKENFKRLVVLGGNTEDFAKYYDGWKILFSSIRGNIEDENTTRLLQSAANEAGFHTDFAYVDEVGFNGEEEKIKVNESFNRILGSCSEASYFRP